MELIRFAGKFDSEWGAGRKLVIIVVYSGHGVQTTSSYFLLNSEEPDKRYSDIENKLTAISDCFERTYTIGLFDCCRQEVSREMMKKRIKMAQINKETEKAIEKLTQVEKSLSILKAEFQRGYINLCEEFFSENQDLVAYFGKDNAKLSQSKEAETCQIDSK